MGRNLQQINLLERELRIIPVMVIYCTKDVLLSLEYGRTLLQTRV